MVIDSVGLLVQDEGVVDEATLAQPAGDAGSVLVDLVLGQLLGSSSGNGVRQDEGTALGQTRGGNLDDLNAVDLAHDALDNHLLRQVAVLHEAGILLQQVSKLVGAESNAASVGHICVTQLLLTSQKQLVSVGLGGGGRSGVALSGCGLSQSVEDMLVILGDDDLTQLARNSLASIQSICYPTGSLSGSSYGFP